MMLNHPLLSMLIASHVLLVWIPILFLSQYLARLNPAISGKVPRRKCLGFLLGCLDLAVSEHPDPSLPPHSPELSNEFLRHVKNIYHGMAYIPTEIRRLIQDGGQRIIK